MRNAAILCLMGALSCASGCSTITGDRYNHVNLTTTPAGAEFEVRRDADNAVVASGVTPNLVKLKSSAGYFKRGAYTVKFRKPGYRDSEMKLSAGMRGIYWGNLLVGGPIGMLIVDPASGAMWALPRALSSDMQPSPLAAVAASTAPSGSPAVISKEQLLHELESDNSLGYEEYMLRRKAIQAQ